ncbi:High-affinity branched-chain amino acid transport system permease protein LivH (TC 3.A.1.4.1) [hydrothermal vent metagenome]|uniref:High-affinity branched-chain amino acid transport system permease protein LivH (TC 3.A.1.4.1) n=1 Tax=hydrothermal vent metagenome TaxID=652676 RepID=A0A3B0Z472_9ZZZZ
MSHSVKPTLTKLQTKWLAIINACEASGKSMRAYADSKGLVAQNLYAWKKVLIAKGMVPRDSAGHFVKAKIIDDQLSEVLNKAMQL